MDEGDTLNTNVTGTGDDSVVTVTRVVELGGYVLLIRDAKCLV